MMKLIAETAWHHDGNFDFMSDLVDTIIQQSKAHIVKLHLTLDFDEYMAKDHPGYEFLKERLFNEKQWEEIIYRINKSDKELMLLFNDQQSIDFGMQFNPALVEVHSACLNDINLLKRLKAYNEKINLTAVLGGQKFVNRKFGN